MSWIIASDECGDRARVAFVVARQAAIAADPYLASLDDPRLGHDNELVQFGELDDLDYPAAVVRGGHAACSLVARIGEDLHDERRQRTRLFLKHEFHAVTIP